MSINVLPFYRTDTAGNYEALYSAIVRFRCAAVKGYRLWTYGTEECGRMCWELSVLSQGPESCRLARIKWTVTRCKRMEYITSFIPFIKIQLRNAVRI